MRYDSDGRTVLTLDAGGTTFHFSALRGNSEVTIPLTLPSNGRDLDLCMKTVLKGFEAIRAQLHDPPVAISFAFPGPADYPAGIIGDLENLPAFRGGVALGPMLQDHFGLPVFINNDGDLFTYGEAIGGLLPAINSELAAAGATRVLKNLFGVTLGTGFGAGFVHGERMFLGDNSAGAEICQVRNKLSFESPAEEGASIRGIVRAYAELAGISPEGAPDPKEIAEIAGGKRAGDAAAAREAFRRFGEVAGDALANASTLLDSLVVIGGGLSGAATLFLPELVAEMNRPMRRQDGSELPRLDSTVFNLEEPSGRAAFLRPETREIPVPVGSRKVMYEATKRLGAGLSVLGTSRAIAVGAYQFAIEKLDAAE